eukprot:3648525-Rhodomonas_salina.1
MELSSVGVAAPHRMIEIPTELQPNYETAAVLKQYQHLRIILIQPEPQYAGGRNSHEQYEVPVPVLFTRHLPVHVYETS